MKLPYTLTLTVPDQGFIDLYVGEISMILKEHFLSFEIYTYEFRIHLRLIALESVKTLVLRDLRDTLGIEEVQE